jgi:hypothetical protein
VLLPPDIDYQPHPRAELSEVCQYAAWARALDAGDPSREQAIERLESEADRVLAAADPAFAAELGIREES